MLARYAAVHERNISANERKSAQKNANERKLEKRSAVMAEMGRSNIATRTFSGSELNILLVTEKSMPEQKKNRTANLCYVGGSRTSGEQ